MKAKFVQDGKYIDYTASADISAGDVVVIGALVGVANGAIASGKTGAIATEGVFEVEKDDAAISAGAVVYWTGSKATASADNGASGDSQVSYVVMGKAVAAADANDASVRVML